MLKRRAKQSAKTTIGWSPYIAFCGIQMIAQSRPQFLRAKLLRNLNLHLTRSKTNNDTRQQSFCYTWIYQAWPKVAEWIRRPTISACMHSLHDLMVVCWSPAWLITSQQSLYIHQISQLTSCRIGSANFSLRKSVRSK